VATLLELPFCNKDPGKNLIICNVAPGAAGRRGLCNSGEAGVVPGRGRGGEELGGHLGPIRVWFRGGEAGGKGARRSSRVACAWSSAPASSRPGYHAGGGEGSSRT
jgi:hypothetical protein